MIIIYIYIIVHFIFYPNFVKKLHNRLSNHQDHSCRRIVLIQRIICSFLSMGLISILVFFWTSRADTPLQVNINDIFENCFICHNLIAREDFHLSDFNQMAAGLLFSGLIIGVLARLSKRIRASIFRIIGPLKPQNFFEVILFIALCLNAGFSEELYFRWLWPTLINKILKLPELSIILSCLVFGIYHLYQGFRGVFLTTIAALVLFRIFYISHNIIFIVIIHAIIDLNMIIMVPAVVLGFRRPHVH